MIKMFLAVSLVLNALMAIIFISTVNFDAEILYSNLQKEDALRLAKKLIDRKISYEIRDGGKTITVYSDHIDGLRAELNSQKF